MVLASSGDAVNRAARIPTWTPCSTDPVSFDCQDCEIGWSPCKLRLDDSLRHWRAAQYNRLSGFLSANEERDNKIESEIVRLLLAHGVSVNVSVLLGYVSRETLDGITAIELENLLRKSPKFIESSPRMFKPKDSVQEDGSVASFGPLPISSGTQLDSLIEDSPTLGVPRQTRLFKEFRGLSLLTSFETRQTARMALDEIVDDCLKTVLSRREWTIQTMHRYAVGPETVPNNGAIPEDVAVTSRLLSAVSASELLTRMSPAEAFKLGSEVRQALILGNLRLVAHEARKRANGGFLTLADLVQVGTFGLMTAIEKFDPFRGFQFSTYATYWIRQAIGREQANLDRSIRLPVHVIEELNSLLQRRQELESYLNRIPTIVELASELSLRPDRVEFLLQLERPPESLDLLLMEGGAGAAEKESRLHESTDGGEGINQGDWILRDAVEKVLVSLSSREAQIVKLRFGIGGKHAETLEQVGQHFGVTRERIRQIEARALKKLQRPENAHQLRDLL